MIPAVDRGDQGKSGGGMGSNLGLTALGITMGLCVGIGTGAGYLLDRRLGSTPTFMVVGFLLGTVAAFREVFRAAKKG